eukprot:gene5707-7101_t
MNTTLDFSHFFTQTKLENLIKQWIDEDIPSFDYAGVVVGVEHREAQLLGKQKGVFSGTPFFLEIFKQLNCEVELFIKDGDEFDPAKNDGKPVVLGRVAGPVKNILIGERLSLNIVSRSCAITTRVRSVLDIVKSGDKPWKGTVAGTRKTTPGFRLVEKYALIVGGADTHRMDLSSMLMLKDNHIWSCNNKIRDTVNKARSVAGFSLKIEVECRSMEEAVEAIESGADVVMLDNFNPSDLKSVSSTLKSKYPHVVLEASGGINPSTISQYAIDTIDIVSMGSLTQGVPHVDISLKIKK